MREHLKPWLWLPLFVGLSIQYALTDTIAFTGIDVLIPLAALLGYRYGRLGLVVVAVGGLVLLVGVRDGPLEIGGHVDIYVAALLVCFGAQSLDSFLAARVQASRGQLVAAFILLPIAIGLYRKSFGDLDVSLVLRFEVLLYVLLFALGVMQFNSRTVILLLAVFAVLGIGLEALHLPDNASDALGGPRAELPLLGLTDLNSLWINYTLDNPARFFATIGWFAVGKQVASMYANPDRIVETWRRSYLPITLLAIVGLGGELSSYLARSLFGAEAPDEFRLLGAFYALPCAALWGGLVLRRLGVSLVFGLLVVFLVLDGFLRAGFESWHPLIDIGDPIVVLSFGALGLGLRNHILRTSDRWWSSRWALYVLLCGAIVPLFFSWDSLADLLWAALSFIGALVVGRVLAWLRRRYLSGLPDHGGWIALLFVALIGTALWQERHIPVDGVCAVISDVASETTSSSDPDERGRLADVDAWEILPTIFVVMGIGLFLGAVQALVRRTPDCARDVQALVKLPFTSNPTTKATLQADAHSTVPGVVTAWLGVLRNVVIGFAVAGAIALGIVDVYPEQGVTAVLNDWCTARSEPPRDEQADTNAVEESLVHADRFLWQAALELAPPPFVEADAVNGTLRTDWYSAPGEPNVRRRMDIHVGRVLEAYAISIELRREDRGMFGLWVEQGRVWSARKRDFVGQDTYAEQKEIEQRLLDRAKQLADATRDGAVATRRIERTHVLSAPNAETRLNVLLGRARLHCKLGSPDSARCSIDLPRSTLDEKNSDHQKWIAAFDARLKNCERGP